MNEWITYLVKVAALQGLLFTAYWLLLRGSKRHAINRYYLLLAFACAFFIPFITITLPSNSVIVPTNQYIESVVLPMQWESNEATTEQVNVKHTEPWAWQNTLMSLYLLVALGLLVRSIIGLFLISNIKKRSLYVEKKWYRLFKTGHAHPFSFFSSIFIPSSVFGTSAYDQILAHECEHVKQRHSYDRLLMDIAVSLFWFSPFTYLYRKALIEIHEFQADEAVVRRFQNPAAYQEILYAQLSTGQFPMMVSHFNFSTIKKRIVMINTNKKQSILGYAILLPILLSLIFAFAGKKTAIAYNKLHDVPPAGTTPSLAIPQNGSDVPSILPLRTTANFTVSSGFGKKMDAADGKMKQHTGMDFAIEEGAEVLATADGVVKSVIVNDPTLGNAIFIDHSEKYETRYHHLSAVRVKNGDHVKMGEVIALTGNTGRSSGPHLHYEVLETDKGHVNPLLFIHNYTFVASGQEQEIKVRKGSTTSQVAAYREAELARQLAAKDQEKAMIKQQEAELAQRTAQQQQEKAEAERKRIAEHKQNDIQQSFALVKDEQDAQEKDVQSDAQTLAKVITINGSGTSVYQNANTKIQPIFILDGVLVNTLEEIDPKVIYRIDVLKGKSAIDKYGPSGSNGVIEITTKSNQKKKKK